MLADAVSKLLEHVDTVILWVAVVVVMTGMAFCIREYRRDASPKQVLASRVFGAFLVLLGIAGMVLASTTDLFGK